MGTNPLSGVLEPDIESYTHVEQRSTLPPLSRPINEVEIKRLRGEIFSYITGTEMSPFWRIHNPWMYRKYTF